MFANKIFLILIIIICIYPVTVVEAETDIKFLFGNRTCSPPITCPFIPKGHTIPQPKQCCRNLTLSFYCNWRRGGSQLTRFLQTLRSWNCTDEFEHECKERYFGWTDFTSTAYLSFCDRNALEDKCFKKVISLTDHSDDSDDKPTWKSAVSKLEATKLKDEDLLDTCVQIAIYEADYEDNFVETVEFDFMLCDLVWYGFDQSILKRRDFSLWTLLPSRCKLKIQGITVIKSVLGFVGLLVNCILIAVIYVTPSLHHNQYVYKASIAVSDIIMCILVFPSVMYNAFTQTFKRFVFREVVLPWNQTRNITTFVRDKTHELFTQSYLDGFGVFSTLVIFVSIYTLLLATADRLYAVGYPFKYKKTTSIKMSLYLSLLVWIIGLVTAVLPTLTDPHILAYELHSRALITTHGNSGGLFFGVLLGMPIPLMWLLSILTFVIILKSTRKMKASKTRNTDFKKNKQEIRLAVTLLLMVGTFTLSILPFAILILYYNFLVTPPNLNIPTEVNFAAINSFLHFEFVAFTLFLFNTMWNFFIYNARNKHFRVACLRIMQRALLAIRCSSLHSKISMYIDSQSTLQNTKKSNREGKKKSLFGRSCLKSRGSETYDSHVTSSATSGPNTQNAVVNVTSV